MKKLIFILMVLPFLGKAQVYPAGTIFPYYYDINPDTLLSYYHAGPSGFKTESFSIDLNMDSQYDLKLEAYESHSPGGGYGHLVVKSLNPNSFKRFYRLDGNFNNSKVALPLQVGDSINSLIAMWDTAAVYIAASTSGFTGTSNITDWFNINDAYHAVKYQDSCDTVYGWIRINCQKTQPYNTTYEVKSYVKDFSWQKISSVLMVSNTPSLICSSESVTLSVSGANTYTWSTGSNASSIIVSPTVTTNYTVNGTTSNGCPLSSVITQSVSACIGIKEYDQNASIRLYPNPTNNKVEFVLNPSLVDIKIKVINSLGQIILKDKKLNSNQFNLDVSNYANGIYFVELESSQGILRTKFVKE